MIPDIIPPSDIYCTYHRVDGKSFAEFVAVMVRQLIQEKGLVLRP